MTGNVVDLASRRQPAAPCCPRHELHALVTRARQRLAAHPDELLIVRTELEALIADLEHTTARLVDTPADARRDGP